VDSEESAKGTSMGSISSQERELKELEVHSPKPFFASEGILGVSITSRFTGS
jgi:hypothetical protein